VHKKGREAYQPWIPNEKEISVLEDAVPIPCQGVFLARYATTLIEVIVKKGRRGLLNLGQTCFLNVVLQSFVHNPLLRNYFLSDKHNPKSCKLKDCTCCEMDILFSEVYSGEATPYGPLTFLATTWRASSELAGYAQQDAHEFFITALNQIHLKSRGSTNVSCNCIIHNTFSGQLQSEVKCERCGNVTTTVDLEGEDSESGVENTLASCLRRYCVTILIPGLYN
jgi:ubiquitin carboxyl-terminal hydrolase 22/27/51